MVTQWAGNLELGRPSSRGTPIPAPGSLEKGGEAEKRGGDPAISNSDSQNGLCTPGLGTTWADPDHRPPQGPCCGNP